MPLILAAFIGLVVTADAILKWGFLPSDGAAQAMLGFAVVMLSIDRMFRSNKSN